MLAKEELVQGEHRMCPECGRLLRQWRGKYLCYTCWLLFNGVEGTVARDNFEGLCTFSIVKDSEVQRWRICGKCGKLWVMDWDREYLFEMSNELEFSQEYVDRQRQELLTRREENERVCTGLRKQNDLYRAFVEYESSLVGLAPTQTG